jgi:hypothetical protein
MANNRIGSLIRLLGSPNDSEVLTTAKALVSEMEGIGGLDALAKLWEQQSVSLQRPKPKPFDFSKVAPAVELFTTDKNEVTINDVLKAVKQTVAEVRALEEAPNRDEQLFAVSRYVCARLQRLGFRASSSGMTWSRAG